MITGKDLMNMDYFLMKQESIINQPRKEKRILRKLRILIAEEFSQIEIKIKKVEK